MKIRILVLLQLRSRSTIDIETKTAGKGFNQRAPVYVGTTVSMWEWHVKASKKATYINTSYKYIIIKKIHKEMRKSKRMKPAQRSIQKHVTPVLYWRHEAHTLSINSKSNQFKHVFINVNNYTKRISAHIYSSYISSYQWNRMSNWIFSKARIKKNIIVEIGNLHYNYLHAVEITVFYILIIIIIIN